jgi:hypothetical protein
LAVKLRRKGQILSLSGKHSLPASGVAGGDSPGFWRHLPTTAFSFNLFRLK